MQSPTNSNAGTAVEIDLGQLPVEVPAVAKLAESITHATAKEMPAEYKPLIDRVMAARQGASSDARPIDLLSGERTTIGKRFKQTTVGTAYGRMLFCLIAAFEPRKAIELGTSLGGSTLFQAAALDHAGAGDLYTLELHEPSIAAAQEMVTQAGFGRVHYKQGAFQEILEPVLEEMGHVDYAFIDGHHREGPTIRYFEQVLPFAADPAVLVFDDITWSEEMERAWASIRQHPRVKVAVSTERMGICLLSDSIPQKLHLHIDL